MHARVILATLFLAGCGGECSAFKADYDRIRAHETCVTECRGENFVEVYRLHSDGRVECFCKPYQQWRGQ